MLTRKPRKGDTIRWPNSGSVVTVDHVDGNICHTIDADGKHDLFIWNFRDGMNTLAQIVRVS